ncbi:MAG: hypothetical protein V3V10_09415, partial [Planctomycetota bacterium]
MHTKYTTTGGATSPAYTDPNKGYGQYDNGEFVSAAKPDLWAEYPIGTRAKLVEPARFSRGIIVIEYIKGRERWAPQNKTLYGYKSLADLDAIYPVAQVVGPPSPSIPEIEPP